MSKHLQRDLETLEGHLLEMSSRVEGMIELACHGLVTRDLSQVSEVLEEERKIDDQEVQIEEECLKILALHQPVAGDLRRVTTLLKINNELERIADLAVNIAQRSISLAERPELPLHESIERMSAEAVEMVRQSLDAFVREDVDVAREVIAADDQVDELNREAIAAMSLQMQQQADQVPAALLCFSASRHIERIADHATNIAEDVLYLVGGEIARHKNIEPPFSNAQK